VPTLPGARARLAAGGVLALLTLWLALRGTDIQALRNAVLDVHAGWVGAALASVVLTVFTVVFRWRLLFHPDERQRRWSSLTGGVVIGQALNILLPLRLGEIARGYVVSRAEDLPASRVLTTIAVEKLADLVSVGLAAGVVLMSLSTPQWLYAPGRALLVTGGLAMIAVLVLGVRGDAILETALKIAGFVVPAWAARLRRWFGPGLTGLGALHNWRVSLVIWILSALIVMLAASTNYLLFLAFDLVLPASAALVLLLALQVGNSLVSVPGNLGVFHYVTVIALGAYGVGRDAAVAYAFVLYAVAVLPKILVGGALMAFGPAASFQWASIFPSRSGRC
jgi:glycosyltransferase 2 family protein